MIDGSGGVPLPLSHKGNPMSADTAPSRLVPRALTGLAGALYVAALALPFVHGTIRMLLAFSRDLTLLAFMQQLADRQPGVITVLVTVVIGILPLALLATAALVSWRGVPAPLRVFGPRLHWAAWGVAALGVVFMIGMCSASSATGGPKLRLLPGAWCFCLALVAAAGAVMVARPARAGRGKG